MNALTLQKDFFKSVVYISMLRQCDCESSQKQKVSLLKQQLFAQLFRIYLPVKLNNRKMSMQKENTFPTDNFKKYSKKYNPKITILKILVYKIQQETIKSKSFMRFNFITKPCSKKQGFVIKLKPVKNLNFIISGCNLYIKIFRMVTFGLFFLLYKTKKFHHIHG